MIRKELSDHCKRNKMNLMTKTRQKTDATMNQQFTRTRIKSCKKISPFLEDKAGILQRQ